MINHNSWSTFSCHCLFDQFDLLNQFDLSKTNLKPMRNTSLFYSFFIPSPRSIRKIFTVYTRTIIFSIFCTVYINNHSIYTKRLFQAIWHILNDGKNQHGQHNLYNRYWTYLRDSKCLELKTCDRRLVKLNTI